MSVHERHPALAAVFLLVLGLAGCGQDCHEFDVRFDAVLPALTVSGAAVLTNAAVASPGGADLSPQPTRVEGADELVLTIRADVPVALYGCDAGSADTARGERLDAGDARGATVHPFRGCFWLETADGTSSTAWTAQVSVAAERYFVFGREITVDPREGCPGAPPQSDLIWTLRAMTGG